MKTEWGFDEFIALETFNDPSNGYLIDDVCVFGVEVFVCKERTRGKGECISKIVGDTTCKHTWKIENLLDEKILRECLESEEFMAGDHKWKIQLYPKGLGEGKGNSISLYLVLVDSTTLPFGRKLYADFTLKLLDRNNNTLKKARDNHWFSVSSDSKGWQKFLPININSLDRSAVLLCIFEAEVTVLRVVDKLQ